MADTKARSLDVVDRTRKPCFFVGLVSLCLLCALPKSFAQVETVKLDGLRKIEVQPGKFELQGPHQSVRLLVSGRFDNGEVCDFTHQATFASSNENVASVDAVGKVRPHADGELQVTVNVGRFQAKTQITVANTQQPQTVSFQDEVIAALSKQGCNAGACHGSPSGKGGFRLSLRGFDPTFDAYMLVKENAGRRTNSFDPKSSLLLQKPMMKVAHAGGKKLSSSEPAYRVLHDWIEQGCKVDLKAQPHCVGIRILPSSNRTLTWPAFRQQVSVLADFSDGTQRDVTDLAVFSSSDLAIATVDNNGLVHGKDRGEAAILVRYLEFIESTHLMFVKPIKEFRWTQPVVHNYIDTHVYGKLKKLQFLPSDSCTDEEFLRRVYLDVIGLLPTIDEVNAFRSDPSKEKRNRLIDQLLERPEFAKFWTLKWGDLLKMTASQLGDRGVHKFHRWVEHAVSTNLPYDQFARELLTASGSAFANPPANFFRMAKEPGEQMETVSQVFLGARLQCAKCHNHPFEKWTQDNYYGMTAFFHRIRKEKAKRPGDFVVYSVGEGEVTQPRTGKTMAPWLPEADSIADKHSHDRRVAFADWLTDRDNPFFAKMEVNRIWSHLFGKGIVDPVDDFRDSNPPCNSGLLDALARDFVANGFDRKHIIRTILRSHTYQLSHRTNRFNRTDTKYFSHYQPRLLSAEQLLDAVCQVTGVSEAFRSLPSNVKATQLPAPDLVDHAFLKTFGQPKRQTVCECERASDSNLAMAIEFLNGPLINGKIRNEKNRFRRLVESGKTDEHIIQQLTLVALSRPASKLEIEKAAEHLASQQRAYEKRNRQIEGVLNEAKRSFRAFQEKHPPNKTLSDELKKEFDEMQKQVTQLQKQIKTRQQIRIIALEDLCWALLNRNEFLTNH